VKAGLRLHFTIWKEINSETNKIDLTFNQAQALIFLKDNFGVTMTKIAKEVGLTTAAITGLIDRLVEKGLVQRKYDLKDRRVIFAEITNKGKVKVRHFLSIFKRRIP
jgi:DNA-binding MarR family transcriptional regulator